MKKEYISPRADMMIIESRQMIATSTLDSNPSSNVNVNLTEEEYNGEGASRRRSVWSEEEEEDF